jgi:hypothetical protein
LFDRYHFRRSTDALHKRRPIANPAKDEPSPLAVAAYEGGRRAVEALYANSRQLGSRPEALGKANQVTRRGRPLYAKGMFQLIRIGGDLMKAKDEGETN